MVVLLAALFQACKEDGNIQSTQSIGQITNTPQGGISTMAIWKNIFTITKSCLTHLSSVPSVPSMKLTVSLSEQLVVVPGTDAIFV